MNSMCNGKAGEEGLVEGDLALQPAQGVKLRIIAEDNTFKVRQTDRQTDTDRQSDRRSKWNEVTRHTKSRMKK